MSVFEGRHIASGTVSEAHKIAHLVPNRGDVGDYAQEFVNYCFEHRDCPKWIKSKDSTNAP